MKRFMKKFNMDKRGASVDSFWVMVSFMVLVIFFLAILLFWLGIKNLDDEFWDKSSVGSEIKQNTQNFINTFDFILAITYFGLHLGIIAMAYLLRTHPVIYVVSIVLVAILALVAAPLSNAYEDLKDNGDLATVSVDIPVTNFIMSQLPKFEIIWGILTVIVMFGFSRYERLGT